MKLPTSNKTASYGKKPYVKKGYYPALLKDVKPFANKDGVLLEKQYGHMLILEFEVYNKDENDAPTTPMKFSEEGKADVNVILPKFVYYENKNDKITEEDPEPYRTAFTPNSAITKLFENLGWTFSEEDIELNDYIGQWAEVNVNDYEQEPKDGPKYMASSIASVEKYKGPAQEERKSEPEAPKKESTEAPAHEAAVTDEKSVLEEQLVSLKKLHDDGNLSDDGFKTSSEQIQAKLDALNK